ncbi:MAG: ABC transporter substrate-binding protein [Treponema sp.]|jgi:iron complex transport system substrate-binding protein|nr:ABC transporter substrate-binding protein [Treponema sp.]
MFCSMKNRLSPAVAAFCCIFWLSACSKPDASSTAGGSAGRAVSGETGPEGSAYPLRLENFDASGNPYTQVFTKAPERVVATTQGSIEALLKLGLGGRIVGVANIISDFPDDIRAEGEKLPVISNQWPPMELVLGASPDLVMGRAMDFNEGEYGLGTVETYTAMGINSYIWASSSLTGNPTLEDIIDDIRDIGLVFGIQPAADAFAAELRGKLDRLKAVLAGRSGGKKALMITDFDGSTYGQYGAKAKLQNDFLAKLGFTNATEQAGTSLGLETMIALNPDMIIYIDYADSPLNASAAIADLLAQASLEKVPAIANRQVFLVPFNDIMGHGYCTIEGLARLAEQVYPDLM